MSSCGEVRQKCLPMLSKLNALFANSNWVNALPVYMLAIFLFWSDINIPLWSGSKALWFLFANSNWVNALPVYMLDIYLFWSEINIPLWSGSKTQWFFACDKYGTVLFLCINLLFFCGKGHELCLWILEKLGFALSVYYICFPFLVVKLHKYSPYARDSWPVKWRWMIMLLISFKVFLWDLSWFCVKGCFVWHYAHVSRLYSFYAFPRNPQDFL